MCTDPPSAGRLVILVPYRDRKNYIDILLREVPSYVERLNGISDYVIYVAEQESSERSRVSAGSSVAISRACRSAMTKSLLSRAIETSAIYPREKRGQLKSSDGFGAPVDVWKAVCEFADRARLRATRKRGYGRPSWPRRAQRRPAGTRCPPLPPRSAVRQPRRC